MPELEDGIEQQEELEAQDAQAVVEDDKPELTDEDKDAIIAKLRRENASRRTTSKAEKAELDAFKAWKESQMTEQEKLQARLAEAEERAVAAERKAIIKEFDIPDELQEFISGSSEEMQARAELLASKLTATKRTAPQDRSAVRKRSESDDGGDFLRALALRDLGM